MDNYDMVVHMVTAADGKEEFYTLENNEARSETVEQAKELDKKTIHFIQQICKEKQSCVC